MDELTTYVRCRGQYGLRQIQCNYLTSRMKGNHLTARMDEFTTHVGEGTSTVLHQIVN